MPQFSKTQLANASALIALIDKHRPLMTERELSEIREQDDKAWVLVNTDYDAAMDMMMASPHREKQDASYAAYVDAAFALPFMAFVPREVVQNTLGCYYDYYFGEGFPHFQQVNTLCHVLQKYWVERKAVK